MGCEDYSVIGTRQPLIDALIKATGQAEYTSDLSLPRMLIGKMLGSPYPHAKVLKVDASRALALKGVRAVVTGADIPGRKYGTFASRMDETGLTRKVRYIGDPVAAVGNEQCRMLGDSQPPWGFLKIYRYLEAYGVVSVASLYTLSLTGWCKFENGNLVLYPTLQEQGITIKDRDHALRLLAEGELKGKLQWAPFYGASYKNDLAIKMAKQWKCDAAIILLNRGCEGSALHQMEMKNALQKMGLPVLTFEGNMADEREFDEARTARLIDLFVTETLGLKKVAV